MIGLRIRKPVETTALPFVLRIERTVEDVPWYVARSLDGSYRIRSSSGEQGRRDFANYRRRIGVPV